MAEIEWVVSALKQVLRERALTYKKLGREIGLSESSVKRLFHQRKFSLHQLQKICSLLGITFLDLFNRARNLSEADYYRLSIEQEKLLVSDMKFYSFFWMLVNRNPLKMMIKKFKLSSQEAQKYLLKLDAMKIIELREKDRFTLKVPQNILWNEDGPIEKIVVEKTLPSFLSQKFNREGDYRKFFVCKLTPESILKFKNAVQKLTEEIHRQSMHTDAILEDSKNTGFLIAFGPTTFSVKEILGKSARTPSQTPSAEKK